MARARRTPRPKPPARKPRARREPARDPEQVKMEQLAVEMLEVMSCPILVAEDQAERCVEMMMQAEEVRDLAVIAQRIHVDQPDVAVAPVLVDVAMTLDRHARELAALADRLVPLLDHDLPHDHARLDDETAKQILTAMFGEPTEELTE